MASSSLVLSGGRKRSMPLKEMFANGLLKEGELLRYKARQELGAIGWAYAGGIKVPGKEGLLGCTAFEGHAGSKLHRPYEHIYTAAGVSLQELIMGVSSSQPASREGSPAAGRPGDQNAYGRAGALADPEVTLLEGHDDPNDEFCRMCTGDGFDGDLVCCETCPATFHFAPECLDIAAVPEGDWYCPMCRCVRCGHGTFAPPLQLPQQVLWLPSPEDQVTDASAQPLPVVHYPRDAVRAATAVKMEADSGGIQLEAAAKGKQKKRKLEEPAPLGDDGAALPAGIDAFLDLARAVANPAALLAALQERLPSAMGSAKKAQPLKDLFAALVPGSAFSGRNSALAAISKRLWELRNAPVNPPSDPADMRAAKRLETPPAAPAQADPAAGHPQQAQHAQQPAVKPEQAQHAQQPAVKPEQAQHAAAAELTAGQPQRAEPAGHTSSTDKEHGAQAGILQNAPPEPAGVLSIAPAEVPQEGKRLRTPPRWQQQDVLQEVKDAHQQASPSSAGSRKAASKASPGKAAKSSPAAAQHAQHSTACKLMEPRGPAPSGAAAAEVACPGCERRFHFGCLSAEEQALLQMPGRLWWCSAGCERVSRGMAEAAGSGPQACHSQHLDAPLSWQLIRSTALSEPQACRGYAPQYTPGQAAQLKQVLLAARHILSESFEPLPDARVSMDLVPLLLQGKVTPERALDFGGAHVAVLWAGGSIASVAVVRALAAEFGEVILLASRPELHGNGLACALVHELERMFLRLGCQACVMPALPLPEAPPAVEGADPPAHVPRQVSPTGWGTAVGYTWPAMPLRLEMCAFPAMQFPGLPTLHKPLSEKSVALSQPRAGLGRVLTANPGFDLQPHLRSGLLAAVSGSLGPARPAQQAAKPPLAPKPARKATPLVSADAAPVASQGLAGVQRAAATPHPPLFAGSAVASPVAAATAAAAAAAARALAAARAGQGSQAAALPAAPAQYPVAGLPVAAVQYSVAAPGPSVALPAALAPHQPQQAAGSVLPAMPAQPPAAANQPPGSRMAGAKRGPPDAPASAKRKAPRSSEPAASTAAASMPPAAPASAGPAQAHAAATSREPKAAGAPQPAAQHSAGQRSSPVLPRRSPAAAGKVNPFAVVTLPPPIPPLQAPGVLPAAAAAAGQGMMQAMLPPTLPSQSRGAASAERPEGIQVATPVPAQPGKAAAGPRPGSKASPASAAATAAVGAAAAPAAAVTHAHEASATPLTRASRGSVSPSVQGTPAAATGAQEASAAPSTSTRASRGSAVPSAQGAPAAATGAAEASAAPSGSRRSPAAASAEGTPRRPGAASGMGPSTAKSSPPGSQGKKGKAKVGLPPKGRPGQVASQLSPSRLKRPVSNAFSLAK